MADIKKVKDGVYQCLLDYTYDEYETQCWDCPYYSEGITLKECKRQLRNDFLELMKEQEEQIKNRDESLEKAREEIKWLRGMLKEQDAVSPVLDEQTGRIWLCGKCGSYVGFEDNDPHDPNEYDKFCRECGRPVLWEGR